MEKKIEVMSSIIVEQQKAINDQKAKIISL